MPLIIKFSLNTEKYNFNKKLKKISVHHYIDNFKINHNFPGGISSERLGINLITQKKTDNVEIGQEKGIIYIDPEINEDNKISFELALSLKDPLVNFEINYRKPKHPGLIIFNEREIQIKIKKIVKGLEKKFYLYKCLVLSFKFIDIAAKPIYFELFTFLLFMV